MTGNSRLYLDYNASAPLSPAARAVMLEMLELPGNASSIHKEGRELRRRIEAAREALAAHAGIAPKQVVFTSSASEAAATVLSPRHKKGAGEIVCGHLYASSIEHPCVLAGGRFAPRDTSRLPVTTGGVLDLEALQTSLGAHDAAKGPPMVAVMLANNETGAIQPVNEAASLVHAHGGIMVVDAVQGLGRIDVAPQILGADFVIVSAHKAGGPKGAGAILLGSAALLPLPLISGGGQENHLRAGTENVAAIAGFGAAIAVLPSLAEWQAIGRLRTLLEAGLRTISSNANIAAPVIFGETADRLANTSCFAVLGVKAEAALISLDLAGIAASSGSACSSGKVARSHVLQAMSVGDDLAACALRTSLGPGSTNGDVARFLAAWSDIVRRMAIKPQAA